MALIARTRPKRQNTSPVTVSNLSAVAASAATIPPEKWGKIAKASQVKGDWQVEAWQRLKDVGELRFSIYWKRSLVSRFRLVASDVDPDTGQPTGHTDRLIAHDIVSRIAGGTGGQSQMLGRLEVLISVPGEGYIAVIFPDNGLEEQWHVLSRTEIKTKSGVTIIKLPDGSDYELNPDTDTLARIWSPDAECTWDADSPVRAALPILREIVRMTQNIEAAGKSRQAGNGLLILPEEISMAPGNAPTGALDPDAPDLPPGPIPTINYVTADQIRVALQNAMSTAISDPSSAEALVPLILQCKGEWIDKIRHITFASALTEESRTTRTEAIRRLALTLDMPPEVLLGQADLNHWSLWGIEEQALRWHTAPDMETICHGLTEQLLRPMLIRLGEDPDGVVVWYDSSDLESKPDQAEQDTAAYDRGLLTSLAYMRRLDIPEDDGYDIGSEEGWAQWAADMVRRKPELFVQLGPLLRPLLPSLEVTPAEPAELPAAPADEPVDPESDKVIPDTQT